ncbi:hypothetical protein QFZ22_000473 [Streptomyces canus]|uniref:Uncharacterized protein n=1 Tax=Streptomyces canus TaxID=58343 RepID=A0AAW8F4T5_9ACTN|nr:hypothetical protein [Streptomyces canus]MDQ0904488.1 hypothetical protein [Streptomyces canus]
MPTITAPVLPAARSADPDPELPPGRYENWRPPVIGVAILVPVGADALVVADLSGLIMLPTGAVHDGQTPEQAAQDVLRGIPGGLPLIRRVALASTQMRRRKVVTHYLATEPMTRETVGELTYRDPRAHVRVLPTLRVLDSATAAGQLRILVAFQALATGATAYIEGSVVLPSLPPGLLSRLP